MNNVRLKILWRNWIRVYFMLQISSYIIYAICCLINNKYKWYLSIYMYWEIYTYSLYSVQWLKIIFYCKFLYITTTIMRAKFITKITIFSIWIMNDIFDVRVCNNRFYIWNNWFLQLLLSSLIFLILSRISFRLLWGVAVLYYL